MNFTSSDSPIQSDPNTFPPPPNRNMPPMSSSPTSAASRAASNALSRALNLASKKLFGVTSSPSRSSHYRDYSASSPRRPQIIAGRGSEEDRERDPLEDELLATLEELAQKTDVLTHWADEMYEYVKAVPQSTLTLLVSYEQSALNLMMQNPSRTPTSSRNGKVRLRSTPSVEEMPTWKQSTMPSLAWRYTYCSCRSLKGYRQAAEPPGTYEDAESRWGVCCQ